MIRIRSVERLEKFKVRLELTDGTRRTIDLEPYLRGTVFTPLRTDPKLYKTMRVDPALGTLVWANGSDIDPDVLIGKHIPEWMEEQPEKSYPQSRSHKHTVAESKTRYKAKRKK